MKKTIGMVLLYLLAFVLLVAGVFCGIRLYKEVKAESYVNDSIDISNRFSQESFVYSATSVVFYHDLYDETETYTFNKELLKTENFDGLKNKYRVMLNDYILLDTQISAGTVFSTLNIDFYDTGGEIVCSAVMEIKIEFLSNKTVLSFMTRGNEQASFLEQYFTDNGIRLKVYSSAQTGYAPQVGLVMYGDVHSRRRLADCCSSAPRLHFQNSTKGGA